MAKHVRIGTRGGIFNHSSGGQRMMSFFRALMQRFKNLFMTHAALDLEAELLAQAAERKEALLRRARRYEKEGMNGVALLLRKQADGLSADRPLAGVQATERHLAVTEDMAPS